MMLRGKIFVAITIVLVGAGVALGQAPGDKAEALAEAARKGDAATVRKLLDEGIDVNTKFRYGATALFAACDRGHLEVVKVLLERGADVNVRDTFYMATALNWAVTPAMGRTPQHPEIVRLLLQKGAQGKGPALTAAISAGDTAMTKIILESGAFPADALSDALEAATRANKRDIVGLLETAGAKPRVEFKIEEAQLARYAGTYRGPGDAEMVLTVVNGRLTGGPGGQKLTLVARDAKTFGVTEAPGLTLTFQIEGDKVTGIRTNNNTAWTRVEGK